MLTRQKVLQALPAIERYTATVLAVVCTVAIRLVFDPMLGDRAPYLFFVLTIVIVKRLWGRGPGLLATLLGGLSAWYFIIEPRFSFAIANRAVMLNLACYFAVGAGISFLGEMSGLVPSSISVGGRNINVRIFRQTVVLAGAAVVLAGMVLLLLRDFERTRDAEGWVVHTYRVINSAESVLSLTKDAETGERGYLLTGDESYLAPYNSAITALPIGLKDLKDLTSDNPHQQARWIEINRLAGERLSLLKRAIELRKAAEIDAALALVRSGQGVQSMDELRSTLDAVVGEERRLLAERTAETAARASRGRWILGLGSTALILLLVFASVVIERETVRREEITQALRHHADLLEQAHDSLLICRFRGAIDYWSRGAEVLYGYTREEALGRVSHQLLQTAHPLGMAQIDSLLEHDGHWKGELTQTTKDGRKLTVESQWTLAVDADGNKTVLEANSDITARKRAEEALRESESRERVRAEEFEALMDAAPVGIFRSDDVECHGMTGNRAAYDLLRRPRGSNLSKSGPEGEKPVNFRAMQDGKEIPLPELPMQKAAATGQKVRDTEMDFVFEDGVTVNVLGDAVPLLDESGRPRGAIGTFVDITERKQAEKALEESELRYRQLFERSESALALHEMIFDAQGNPRDYRFVDVNPAFERLTGLRRSHIVGRTALEILPGLEEYWIKLYGRVTTTGEPATFENYTRTLGRYYAGSAYSPRPHQFAVSFMDVTERRRAEEEVRLLNVELEERVRARTAALEAANREMEAFAHSVSHDLRAPLRGIDGWSLALLEDCGERLDEQGHKYLGRVRSEAQRMGRLIDDLLHLSRVGRTEMVSCTVDLTSLATTIVARLKEANPERCIEFMVAPQLQCTGDARLLEIALTNLLENAVKFTGPRNPARVEFGQTEREGKPAFFIRDNGVGFDMAYAKMLFGPFQRLHKANEFPGSGIGLATVQRVIHRHGGRIWAEARVGAGATLYFTVGENKP
jgi:PAS domain S-box-containing protein